MAVTRSGREPPPPPPPSGGPVTMVSEPSLHSPNFPLHLCHQWRPPTHPSPPQQPLPHPTANGILPPPLTTRTPRCQNPQAPPHDRPPTSAPPLFYSVHAAASSFPPHPPATSSPFPQLSPSLFGSSPYARRNPQEKQGVNYPPSVRSDVSLIASSSITHPHRSKEWVDQYLKSLQEKARKQSPPPYYMEYCQEKARRYPTPLQYREYLQEKMEMQPTREVSMSATLPIVDVVEEEENDGELAIGNNEEDQESEASKQDAEASSSQYFNNHGSHFFPKPMPVVEVSLGEMQSTVSAVLEENVEALVEQHRCINIGSLYAQVKELHPWTDAKFVKEVIDASCFTFILVHSSLARLTIALWGSEEHYSKYTSENGSEMVGIVTDASLAPEMHTLEATPVCKALYFLGVMGNSTCSLLDKLCEDGIVRQWVEIIEDGTIVVIFDPGGGEEEATWADTGNDLEEDSLSSSQALGIVELKPREPIPGLMDTAIEANVENGQIVSGFLKIILMNKNDTGKITIVRLLGGYLPDAIEDTGEKRLWICGFFQQVGLYGSGVAYTITVGTSLRAILKSDCYHKEGHEALCSYDVSLFIALFGGVQIVLSQLPGFNDMELLSIVFAIMSLCYSIIGFALGLAKVIENGTIKGGIGGVPAGTMIEKVRRISQGLGDIAFAYPYSILLLEIQDTLKSPPAENKTMKKASRISIVINTVFYLCCGCFGYAAFGNQTPGKLLTGFGFYEPYWLVDFANACIVLHLVGGYQVYCQPVFAFVDRWFVDKFPNSGFVSHYYVIHLLALAPYRVNLLRLCFRTLYVLSTTGIAMLFPYFNQMLGVLGAFGFWPLAIYFPVEMYLVQKEIGAWTREWVVLRSFSCVCLLVSIFGFGEIN